MTPEEKPGVSPETKTERPRRSAGAPGPPKPEELDAAPQPGEASPLLEYEKRGSSDDRTLVLFWSEE